jgi:hypothetical protein
LTLDHEVWDSSKESLKLSVRLRATIAHSLSRTLLGPYSRAVLGPHRTAQGAFS